MDPNAPLDARTLAEIQQLLNRDDHLPELVLMLCRALYVEQWKPGQKVWTTSQGPSACGQHVD